MKFRSNKCRYCIIFIIVFPRANYKISHRSPIARIIIIHWVRWLLLGFWQRALLRAAPSSLHHTRNRKLTGLMNLLWFLFIIILAPLIFPVQCSLSNLYVYGHGFTGFSAAYGNSTVLFTHRRMRIVCRGLVAAPFLSHR